MQGFNTVNSYISNIEISKKQKKCFKIKKAVWGAFTITSLGTIYGVKKFQVKNIKNVQKAFQDVFMRDDITIDDARNILKDYRKIEKISNRKKYIQALFEAAKKNYGFGHSNIKLVLEKGEKIHGFCPNDNSAIYITPNAPKKFLLNVMHHEFRHAKQHLYATPEFTNLDQIFEILFKNTDKIRLQSILKDTDNIHKTKEWQNAVKILRAKKNQNIPVKYKEWADKCSDNIYHYISAKKNIVAYWNNYVEQDARKAGRTIEKFVKSKAFMFRAWYEDLMMKLYTR